MKHEIFNEKMLQKKHEMNKYLKMLNIYTDKKLQYFFTPNLN